MKAIKINAANIQAIQAALVAANGKACTHTFTANEIVDVALAAEFKVIALLGNKKDAVGARMFASSGEKLPNTYKWARQINMMRIERRSSGWWLIELSNDTLNDKSAGSTRLTLTTVQDAKAVARFKKAYQVK
jgi:hypothetical protein